MNLHIVWYAKLKYGGVNWSNPKGMVANLKLIQKRYNGGMEPTDWGMLNIVNELYWMLTNFVTPYQIKASMVIRMLESFQSKSPLEEAICLILGQLQSLRKSELPEMPEVWPDLKFADLE